MDNTQQRSTKSKILSNAFSMIVARIVNLACGCIIGVFLARYLGPERQGIIAYAGSIFGIFTFLSTFGLPNILAREFSLHKSNSKEIAFSAMLIMFICSILASILSIITALYLGVSSEVLFFVFLFSLENLTQMCRVFESWLYSIAKMELFSLTLVVLHIVFLALKAMGIFLKADMTWFVLCIVFEEVFTMLLLVFCYKMIKTPLSGDSTISKNTILFLLKSCWPLVIQGAATMIYMRIDQLMIGSMISDKKTLGLYSIAVTLAELWYFIPSIIYASFFPSLAERYNNKSSYYNLLQKFADIMTSIAYLAIIGATTLGGIFIPMLFGFEYAKSSAILAVYIWTGLLICMSYAEHVTYIIKNHTNIIMITNVLCAIINVIFNYVFIPRFGIYGAALATLIDYVIVRVLILSTNWKKYQDTYVVEIKSLFPFIRMFNYIKGQIKYANN